MSLGLQSRSEKYADLPEVPVEHLDYEYVDKCTKPQELKDILEVLESGKEGRWLDLEKHVEARLLEVSPENERKKILRLKSVPTQSDVSAAEQELAEWEQSIGVMDQRIIHSYATDNAASAPGAQASRSETKDIFGEEDSSEGKSSAASGSRLPPVRNGLVGVRGDGKGGVRNQEADEDDDAEEGALGGERKMSEQEKVRWW